MCNNWNFKINFDSRKPKRNSTPASYIKQIMNVFSFVHRNKYFHSVKDEMYHSNLLRLIEWNNSSFTLWKYLYHCTHKHSLFVYNSCHSHLGIKARLLWLGATTDRIVSLCKIWSIGVSTPSFSTQASLWSQNGRSVNQVYTHCCKSKRYWFYTQYTQHHHWS